MICQQPDWAFYLFSLNFIIQEQTLPFALLLFILNNILNVIDIDWHIAERVASKTQRDLNLFGYLQASYS